MVEFHDVRLRDALAQCGPIIEGYEGRLDAASADIKSLEAYLVGVGKVTESVDLLLSEECMDLPRDESDGLVADRTEGVVERLVFMPRAGRWRLMYVRTRAVGHMEFGENFSSWPVWDLETPVDRRPLIEAPAEVRLRAVNRLPEFVRVVAKLFTVDPSEVEAHAIDFDEIPF